MDALISVNIAAVLFAAVLNEAISIIWYHPLFLGKQWQKAAGLKKKDVASATPQSLLLSFLTSIIGAYVFAHLVLLIIESDIVNLGTVSWYDGVTIGAWAWLAFAGTTSIVNYAYENRSLKLWIINSFQHLASFAMMGAILAVYV